MPKVDDLSIQPRNMRTHHQNKTINLVDSPITCVELPRKCGYPAFEMGNFGAMPRLLRQPVSRAFLALLGEIRTRLIQFVIQAVDVVELDLRARAEDASENEPGCSDHAADRRDEVGVHLSPRSEQSRAMVSFNSATNEAMVPVRTGTGGSVNSAEISTAPP